MKYWIVPFFLLTQSAYAGQTFHCNADGTYSHSKESAQAADYSEPHTLSFSKPCDTDSLVCLDDAGRDAILAIESKYRKCQDTDADTFMDSIVGMDGAEKTAVDDAEAAAIDAGLRSESKAQFDGNNTTAIALRCLTKTILDEVYTPIQTRVSEIEGCIDAAANLGAVKTCVGALADLPSLNLAQAKTVIGSCVDGKGADE
jgi:hypothetical protein